MWGLHSQCGGPHSGKKSDEAKLFAQSQVRTVLSSEMTASSSAQKITLA